MQPCLKLGLLNYTAAKGINVYALNVRLNALSYTLLLSKMHTPYYSPKFLHITCIMQQSADRALKGISNYSIPIAVSDCRNTKVAFSIINTTFKLYSFRMLSKHCRLYNVICIIYYNQSQRIIILHKNCVEKLAILESYFVITFFNKIII